MSGTNQQEEPGPDDGADDAADFVLFERSGDDESVEESIAESDQESGGQLVNSRGGGSVGGTLVGGTKAELDMDESDTDSDAVSDTESREQLSQEPSETSAAKRPYRFSVLLTGAVKMWRAVLPAVLIIAINAAVQTGLLWGDPVAGSGPVFTVVSVLSALMLLITGAVLSAGALVSVDGYASIGRAFGGARSHFLAYLLWVIPQSVLVTAGYAFHVLPGWLLWGLTVFIPLAAIDGRRNAFGGNIRAIGSHPGRWLVTWLLVSLLGLVAWLLGAVNTVFVGGWQGIAIANLVGGVIAWWWLTSWACLYRAQRAR